VPERLLEAEPPRHRFPAAVTVAWPQLRSLLVPAAPATRQYALAVLPLAVAHGVAMGYPLPDPTEWIVSPQWLQAASQAMGQYTGGPETLVIAHIPRGDPQVTRREVRLMLRLDTGDEIFTLDPRLEEAAWDEADHPRDEKGRFSETLGDKLAWTAATPKERAALTARLNFAVKHIPAEIMGRLVNKLDKFDIVDDMDLSVDGEWIDEDRTIRVSAAEIRKLGLSNHVALEKVMRHEVGHAIDFSGTETNGIGLRLGRDFVKAEGEAVSDYAKTNRVERFAEAFAMYFSLHGLPGKTMATKYPKAYKFFHDRFGPIAT